MSIHILCRRMSDNTFATPINCRPFEWGCDIVTHSTTKYMDGHASQVGGVVVDSGTSHYMLPNQSYPNQQQHPQPVRHVHPYTLS